MSAAATPAIRFREVSRRYGDVAAVRDVTFEILDREFFAILGPSGSGKTTCLRLIAGFDQPSSGSLELHGVEAAGVPPYARDVNTVFQDYALFPHMTVAENVAYGLMIRKVPAAERARRAQEMLDLIRLPDIGRRRPGQLSGGQRQRVALARALASRPRVLLLDEPLGALDLKLRQDMQVELKALQQKIGITFVHVTHDQDEALAMSDRLAVFRDGRLEQIGTPRDVYEHPRTSFVADFLGVSNLLSGAAAQSIAGSADSIAIRPEKIAIRSESHPVGPDQCSASGVVHDVVYLGSHTRYLVQLDPGPTVTVIEQNRDDTPSERRFDAGARVRVSWDRRHNRPVVEST